MRRVLSFAVVGAAACMLAASAGVQAQTASLRKEIAAAYARSDRAMKDRDTARLLAMCTPDFSLKAEGRETRRPQLDTMLKENMQRIRSVDGLTTRIDGLTAKGSTVTASVAQTMTAKVLGQDGKLHRVRTTGTSRDTWVRTAQGWRIKRTEQLTARTTLLGERAPARPAGGARGR